MLWMLGMAIGAANAIAANNQRNAEFDDKLDELRRQENILSTQYSQAQASYDLSVEQATQSVENANKELGILADQTIANRDMALTQQGKSGSMQSQLNAMQLATLNIQNEQAQGAANQQVATSGFRNSGTARNVVENAQRSGDMAIKQASLQASMSNYQTYSSALNTFTSANQQYDAYQRQIEANDDNLDMQLEQMELQMDQTTQMYEIEHGYLTADINYMEDEGRDALEQANIWGSLGAVGSGIMMGL